MTITKLLEKDSKPKQNTVVPRYPFVGGFQDSSRYGNLLMFPEKAMNAKWSPKPEEAQRPKNEADKSSMSV